MRVFVLNTGRCGSTTFVKACEHITNFSSGHETRSSLIGLERLDFPDQHIEADNRLAWFLGRLDECFGKEALYVHLYRERDKVARSFAGRRSRGIMRAYERGVLTSSTPPHSALLIAADYVDTVESNIRLFLRDKPLQMCFPLENAKDLFPDFWKRIGAQGDLESAVKEFTKKHNASQTSPLAKLSNWLFR